MIIKLFHGGRTIMIDGVDVCTYRQLEWNEPILARDDIRDFTDASRPAVVGETPVDYKEVQRLEIWYEGAGKEGQVLCHKPVFLMSDEGRTVERI